MCDFVFCCLHTLPPDMTFSFWKDFPLLWEVSIKHGSTSFIDYCSLDHHGYANHHHGCACSVPFYKHWAGDTGAAAMVCYGDHGPLLPLRCDTLHLYAWEVDDLCYIPYDYTALHACNTPSLPFTFTAHCHPATHLPGRRRATAACYS